VTGVPSRAGLALASEFYSPSLDMHHRDLLLTTLATAAQELAHPGAFLQPLPGITAPAAGGGGPAGAAAAAAAGLPPSRAAAWGGGGGGVAGRVGRVTRVSERSLAAQKARERPQGQPHVNRCVRQSGHGRMARWESGALWGEGFWADKV
jgi:hypothetical protein